MFLCAISFYFIANHLKSKPFFKNILGLGGIPKFMTVTNVILARAGKFSM